MTQRVQTNRRKFLMTSALAGTGFWTSTAAAEDSKSPNERIRFACIGIGGKGKEELRDAAKYGDVVAICDIDDEFLGKAGDANKKAKLFQDWREMFDEMGDGIDAVTVSTPDHTHAVIAAAGMRMGKHGFVQKPLTHTFYEARMLGKIAKEQKVATQMGNQDTADSNLRRTAAMIKAGALGPSRKFTCGRIARFGRKASPAPRQSRRRGNCTGSCASARRRIVRSAKTIIRSLGAAGGISAPARWATWPATP